MVRKFVLTAVLANVQPSVSVLAAAAVSKHPTSAMFVVKRIRVRQGTDKQKILGLETALERIKAMRHANVTPIIDFRIEQSREESCFDIVQERSSRGSLADLLGTTDALPPHKARLFGIELLQGLDYLHRNGIVHGRLHTRNILLHGSLDGRASVKVADAAYGDAVHDLIGTTATKRSEQDDATVWTAPELNDTSHDASKSRKSDIWAFGIVMLQMVS